MTSTVTNRKPSGAMKVLLVAVGTIVASTAVAAETVYNSLTYGAYFDFDEQSPKSSGYLLGSYISANVDQTHLFEFGYDRTKLDFGALGDLNQNDITGKYTRYFEGWDVKFGVHGTFSENDTLASDGYTIIGGADAFAAYDYAYGTDLYYSRYKDVVFSGLITGQAASVYQASPYYGKYFPTADGEGWYLQAKADLTQVDSAGQDQFYVAGEALITWYSGPYSVTAKGFVGERQFFVDAGGFTAYNLADIYKGGVKVEAKYTISQKASLKASYSWDRREVNNADSDANIYSLLYGMTF